MPNAKTETSGFANYPFYQERVNPFTIVPSKSNNLE